MSERLSALLLSLMALWRTLVDRNHFWPCLCTNHLNNSIHFRKDLDHILRSQLPCSLAVLSSEEAFISEKENLIGSGI